MGKMVGIFCIFFFFLIYGLELQLSSFFILTLGKKQLLSLFCFCFLLYSTLAFQNYSNSLYES